MMRRSLRSPCGLAAPRPCGCSSRGPQRAAAFWNSGDLPDNWTLKKLLGKHPSCPFNPLIANAFFRAGYIESWGRGIEKIHRACREHGIEPPVYDFGMAGLMLTLRANFAHLQVTALEPGRGIGPVTTQETAGTTQETTQEISRTTQETTQERVLALLRGQPSITRRELASRLGLSDNGIKYHLEKLKTAGVIRHVGATKAGYWEVLK